MTVKPCNRPAVGAHRLGIYRRFSFILTRIMLVLLSLGSAKADVGEVETKTLT